ncbi:MAG: 2-oxoglutarate dehydrogenase complex dihydrolipoyllysine-residue succinyltransferase [Proteobacteria bacterium]|nr:2-oxoglutarate dehydrogenase complex dihydrolipoyllysine-residue succinyltransferase [Pseudomonadota bacterium]
MATEIRVPTLGESVTEATIAKWFKAVGDAVDADEPLVELETDKVTLEVNAPVSGTLAEIRAEEGAEVDVGAVLGLIGEGPAAAKPAAGPAPAPARAEPPAAARPAPAAPPVAPAVRRLLAEHGLEAAAIPASGRDGRLTKEDVLAHLAAQKAAPAAEARPAPAPRPAGPRPEAAREERVRMTRLRRRIAERLKEAQNTAAMLTTFNEADMSAVGELRRLHREGFEKKHGVRLGLMSFFVKASIVALKEFPSVNGEIEGDEIVYKNYYNVGVAVGTPQGLVVPVVRDADRLGFAEIEKAIADLGAKARDGRLAMEDLAGGTFTISNGGVYGSMLSTPILNPPQSGILGMHAIVNRPAAVAGEIKLRPMMYLALSYDHRLVDGREAVSFLVRVKQCIEDPARLLLDL